MIVTGTRFVSTKGFAQRHRAAPGMTGAQYTAEQDVAMRAGLSQGGVDIVPAGPRPHLFCRSESNISASCLAHTQIDHQRQ